MLAVRWGVRNAIAARKIGLVRRLAGEYGRGVSEHASCRGERLRFADLQAQLLVVDGETERAAAYISCRPYSVSRLIFMSRATFG
jgi:hypothetical protein